MVAAAERLAQQGERRIGLLFVVGEENGSDGAQAAADLGPRGRFLINGEPTENRLSIGQKGSLAGGPSSDRARRPLRLSRRRGERDRGPAGYHRAHPPDAPAVRSAARPVHAQPRDSSVAAWHPTSFRRRQARRSSSGRSSRPARSKNAIKGAARARRDCGFPVELPFYKGGAAPGGWDTTVVSYASDLPFLAAVGRRISTRPRHDPGGPHRPGAHPEGRPASGRRPLRASGHRPARPRGRMSAKIPVAVLGATGTVGQKFIRLLADHPWFEVAAVAASSASAGRRYGDVVRWREPVPIPIRRGRHGSSGMRTAAAGTDRLLGAGCRGRGADRAGVRAGWIVRGDEHPHPSHGSRRAPPHPGGQRGSPGADRPAAERAGLERAPSSPTRTALPRRWRWRSRRCTGRSESSGCSCRRCRRSPAPAIPAWHRSTSSATSSRTSAARRRRSSGRAARFSVPLCNGAVEPARFAVSAHTNRVAVVDGHLMTVSVGFGRRVTPG